MTASQPSDRPPTSSPPRARIAIGLAVVAVGIALWFGSAPEHSAPPTGTESASPAPAIAPPTAVPAPPEPTPAGSYDPERVLASGETMVIAAATLPIDAPAVLNLAVPPPPPDAQLLSVRLIAEGRDPLELSGALVGAGRDRLRVEVEPGWLRPGRSIVEVKTLERSHLPLRRYAVEVR